METRVGLSQRQDHAEGPRAGDRAGRRGHRSQIPTGSTQVGSPADRDQPGAAGGPDQSAIATDTWGIEVLPNEIDVWQPLHVVSLAHTGLAFGEMFDLDALSADSAEDGVYEFLFCASPLPLTGASGSPVSALAIK